MTKQLITGQGSAGGKVNEYLPYAGMALDFLGGMASNAMSAKSVKDQMKFQEKMSSTAHQREVEDLRKAGLNPILSAGGQGASAPQGARYQPENPLKGSAEKLMFVNQLKKMQQEIDSASALEFKANAEERLISEKEETEKEVRKMIKYQQSEAKANDDLWKHLNEQGKAGGKIAPYIMKALQILLKKPGGGITINK